MIYKKTASLYYIVLLQFYFLCYYCVLVKFNLVLVYLPKKVLCNLESENTVVLGG